MENDGNKSIAADLHIHTRYSDGDYGIDSVIRKAAESGLEVISITDHDTMDAYPLAEERGKEHNIEIIPGLELSCEIEGTDIHILGYYVDYTDKHLQIKLKEIKDARYVRAERIVKNLNTQGLDLRFETVLKIAGAGAIGRPHIASALFEEELVYSYNEAFDRYIGYESSAYVEKLKIPPAEGFKLIREAGGIPVIAHPGVTKNIDRFIPEFIDSGLKGLEVNHPDHPFGVKEAYRKLCIREGLVSTGGSDFHSDKYCPSRLGSIMAPEDAVFNLKKKLEKTGKVMVK